MATRFESYAGLGPVYLKRKGANEGALPVMNCSALSFAIEENRLSQPDYTNPGGGEASSISRPASVTASMTVLDVSARNLAIALRGGVTKLDGGTTVTDERHTAHPGALIDFEHLPDISDYANTLTVTVDPDSAATPAVEGDDYTVTGVGIVIADEPANITAGSTIAVGYDEAPQSIIEALTEAEAEYELVFDGLNEADSGRAVKVKTFRQSISPAQALNLISDGYGELPMESRVLSDPARRGPGTSGFFQVIKEEAA